MSRSTVVANRLLYTVSPLEPRRRGQIFQAVVVAQLVDGLTGSPVTSGRMRTAHPGLHPRTASSGFVGLAGDPSRAMPALDSTGYDVDVLLEADGFAPRTERVSFTAQLDFPSTFAPADLGVLRMRRVPTTVRTSSYELDPSDRPVPLPGATVRVTGHWPSVDRLSAGPATTPLLAVAPGLYAPRPLGASVDVPALTLPAEPVRVLTSGAAAGTTRLAVSNAGALVAGDLVALDVTDPDRAERIEVVAVHGPADLLSPAEVELRFPTAHPHAEGDRVARIAAPGAVAPTAVLSADALAADRTLLVSALAGFGAGQVVRVSGGTAAPEYHVADLYELTTDGDGFGRFPAMTGLAAVAVSAVSGGLSATARLTLTQPSPAVDLTLK